MSVEYTIKRLDDCTQIERSIGIASQHYVLWPHLVVQMKFVDGVEIEHYRGRTFITDPTLDPFLHDGLRIIKPGVTHRITIES